MDFSHWLDNVLGHLKLHNAARAQCIFLQSATQLFSMPEHAFLTSSLTDVPDWSGWLAACATLQIFVFFPKDDYLGVLKSIVCAGVRVCVCVCVSACE